jgi:divalent metal cation (Fe/Co/Zn/Cd) transporter
VKATVHLVLFLLAVLEATAGLVAGSVALASLITDAAARALSAGAAGFARRYGAQPMTPKLRDQLAAVLSTTTTTSTGGVR